MPDTRNSEAQSEDAEIAAVFEEFLKDEEAKKSAEEVQPEPDANTSSEASPGVETSPVTKESLEASFGRLLEIVRQQREAVRYGDIEGRVELQAQFSEAMLGIPDKGELNAELQARYDALQAEANIELVALKNDLANPPAEIFSEPDTEGQARRYEDALRQARGDAPPGASLDERLEAARQKFVKAEEKLKNSSVTKRLLGATVQRKSYDLLQKTLDAAQTEYQTLRAEYVGASAEHYIGEQEKLLQSRFLQREKSGDKEGFAVKSGKRAIEWYKGLSRHNMEGKLWLGKFGRLLNARTAISVSLLAGGIALGGPAGFAVLGFRRALGGFGAGVGTYDFGSMVSQWRDRGALEKKLKNPNFGYVLEDVEDLIARYEGRALLDGKKLSDLKTDAQYLELLGRRQQILEKTVKGREQMGEPAAGVEEYLAGYFRRGLDTADESLQNRIVSLKNKQAALKGFATAVAASVGLGAASGIVRFFRGDALPSSPSVAHAAAGGTPVATETEVYLNRPKVDVSGDKFGKAADVVRHVDKATGAILEDYSKDTVLHAGQRGLEGSLLDLRKTNSDQYAKMTKWLSEHYSVKSVPDGNTPDKLVHRYILDYAKQNKLNPDQLNKILSGDVAVGSDGHLSMGHVEYIDQHMNPSGGTAAVHTDLPAGEVVPKAPLFSKLESVADMKDHLVVSSSGPSGNLQEALSDTDAVDATTPQVTSSVNEVLGGKSGEFLKFLHLRSQDMLMVEKSSVADFQKAFKSGNVDYQKRYKGLARAVEILVKKAKPIDNIAGQKVRDILRHLAEVYNPKI